MTETLCLSTSETTERAFEIKAGETPGTFEGYGAVFGNKDQDGDIISPGAFSASLTARKPALLWQHDKKQPIGVFEEVREDERGLYVRGRLSMEGKGREAYDLLKLGALNGLSIGFVTREAGRDSVKGARIITKADLMEVSLVTFPANDLARVSAVKAMGDIEDPRSFERFLRDSGFSRNRAKAITAKGFKSADLSAGESAEIAAMVYELKARQEQFERLASEHPHTESKFWQSLLKYFAGVAGDKIEAYVLDYLRAMQQAPALITPQPINLRPNSSASKIVLRQRWDKRTITYSVETIAGNTGLHLFDCKVFYIAWKTSGPSLRHVKLFSRKGQTPVLKANADVGTIQDARSWLKRASRGEVEAAKRLNEMGNYNPYAELNYHGHLMAGHEKFNAPSSARFIIKDN